MPFDEWIVEEKGNQRDRPIWNLVVWSEVLIEMLKLESKS